MWEFHAEEVSEYLAGCTKEPVTESEYRERQLQAQEAFVPVSKLAYVLTSFKEDWADEDLEDAEKNIVKPEAWEPVEREYQRELSRLVSDGVLEAKGKGKALRISSRSFYGWLGREVPVLPEWGAGYDVRPDGEAERVAQERGRRASVRHRLEEILTDDDKAPWWTQASKRLTEVIEAGLKANWPELRALEIVLDEVAEEFGGEDVLKPRLRQDLEETKQKALDLHTAVQDWAGPFELPEPDAEAVEQIRGLLYVWAENRR